MEQNDADKNVVIYDREEYLVHFNKPKEEAKKSMQEEAFKVALDTRKFEIDLYWKRATYFWAFIAASFAGFFLLIKEGTKSPSSVDLKYILIVCIIGWLFSLSWYLVNRGSKFWQENWERHVDYLEDDIVGPLYKTVINPDEVSFLLLNNRYPISVSKINQFLSLGVTLVWSYLILDTVTQMMSNTNGLYVYLIGIVLMLIVIFIIVFLSKSNLPKENERKIKFIMRKHK